MKIKIKTKSGKIPDYFISFNKNAELMHLDDTFIKNNMEMYLSDLN